MNNACTCTRRPRPNLELPARRGVTVIAPGEGELGSHGEYGIGRLPEPAELLPPVEALLDAPTTWSRADASSSPPAAPASRSTASASSATARPGGWASRSPRRPRAAGRDGHADRRQRRSLPAPPASGVLDVEHRRRAAPRRASASSTLRRAADGRRRRRLPPGQPGRSTRSRRTEGAPTIELEPTDGRAQPPSPHGGAPARCWSASPPSTATGAVEYGRGKLERKRLDAVVVNDISTPGIGFDAAENEVTIVTADGGERARAAREQGTASRERSSMKSSDSAQRGRKRMEPEQTPVAPQGSEAVGRARAAARRQHRARRAGARQTLEHLIVALLAEGHVLVEDYPGVGKTALARALARSIDCQFARDAVHLRPAPRRRRRAPTSTTSASSASSSGPARCSPTSCSSTRSTARRRRPSRACSSACRSAASPSTCTRTSWRGRSSCSPPRTRSSTRAPTRCPRRRSTASWSGSRSATRAPPTRPACSPTTRPATGC